MMCKNASQRGKAMVLHPNGHFHNIVEKTLPMVALFWLSVYISPTRPPVSTAREGGKKTPLGDCMVIGN